MSEVILFDVNETLLEVHALNPLFERLFGSASAREAWFKQLEASWLVTIATGRYKDFSKLAEASLQMIADMEGVELASADRAELLERMVTLPPHPDAAPALELLKREGFRLAALTNGTPTALRTQMQHARLEEFFEELFSVDQVERYKPAPEPYHFAARELGVQPGQARLVAAHAWDIAGAHAAGLKTGFVARRGKVLNPAGPEPDLRAPDLLRLADAILDSGG